MKTTLVITILNEEKTIGPLLESLVIQSKKPDEVIIVDGGSTDDTLKKIQNYSSFKILKKKGNRAIGRNEGIKKARGEIILITDAGCVLGKHWIKNITNPFKNSSISVVAGYYTSIAKTIFQKCLVPYVLVMPDKINSNNFLPATRSMAIKKTAWKKVGGFDKNLSHNEDYHFAQKLKKTGLKIEFARHAVVYWIPPKYLITSFRMFFRFAYGDAEAGIFRKKVIFIFFRYALVLLLLKAWTYSGIVFIFLGILITYSIWAAVKNYKYVKDWRAVFILPMLQFTSDLAVITGTSLGLIKRIWVIQKTR